MTAMASTEQTRPSETKPSTPVLPSGVRNPDWKPLGKIAKAPSPKKKKPGRGGGSKVAPKEKPARKPRAEPKPKTPRSEKPAPVDVKVALDRIGKHDGRIVESKCLPASAALYTRFPRPLAPKIFSDSFGTSYAKFVRGAWENRGSKPATELPPSPVKARRVSVPWETAEEIVKAERSGVNLDAIIWAALQAKGLRVTQPKGEPKKD